MSRGLRLELGAHGDIETTTQRRDPATGAWRKAERFRAGDRVRARCYQRRYDGTIREISRTGATKVAALEAVQRALTEQAGVGGGLTASTLVKDAGLVWLAQIERKDSGLSPRTIARYRDVYRLHLVGSSVAHLRLDQVHPASLRTYLQDVADRIGTGAAKHARAVLAGIMRLAVADRVLAVDPLRSLPAVRSEGGGSTDDRRDRRRAFTRGERDAVVASGYARAFEEALDPRSARKRRAAADLVAVMAGTGMRIEEARSLRWEDVDLTKGRVTVRGTKSAAALRALTLPGWLVERLAARREDVAGEGYVIAAPRDGLRPWEQSNSARAVREILDAAGFDWAVPHTFRRTVATLAAGAGRPLVEIADALGHKDPSMTASVYLGRDLMGDRQALADVL